MGKSYLTISFITFALFFELRIAVADGFNGIYSGDGVNVIAVGNSSNLFRSTDAGLNWGKQEFQGPNFKAVTGFDTDVWVAGDNGYIFKTSLVNSPLFPIFIESNFSVNSLDFITSSLGFLCGDGGRVYRSTNGGLNWTSSNSGIENVKLNSISFIDNLNGVVVGNNGKIFTTTDGGLNWNNEIQVSNSDLLNVRYFTDGIVTVGKRGTVLVKQGFRTWQVLNMRIKTDIRGIAGNIIDDAKICGGGGFIRNNSGQDLKFNNFESNPMLADLADIFMYNSAIGFAVSSMSNAIMRTTNSGINWSFAAGTMPSYQWQQKLSASGGIGNNLCAHPADPNTVFCGYGNRVYVSRDRCETWIQIAQATGMGNNMHSFYVSPLDTNVWVAAITGSPDRVIKSTNYGNNWTISLQMNFSNYGQPLEMDQNNPSVYYFAPDGGGFYKSIDNGSTFAEISNNYPFRSPCDILVTWDSSNVLFVADGVTGSGQAVIFKSVNGGNTWSSVRTVSSSEIPSMCNTQFDNNLVYATEWSGSNIYKSTDFGSSFAVSHSTGFSGWASAFCSEDPTLLMTGNYGSNSSFSTNKGLTWITQGGMSGAGAGMLIPDRGMILAMQTSSIFKLRANYSVQFNLLDTNFFNPVLIEPNNHAENLPTGLTFRWSSSMAPTFYIFQLSTDSVFGSLVKNDTIVGDTSKFVSSLNYNTKYFWRVISVNSFNQSFFSMVFDFRTTSLPQVKLNVTVALEGMYYPLFNQHSRRDTLRVYLRSATPPYALIDSGVSVIDSLNLISAFTFDNVNSGRFYIVLKHFQSLETWSRSGGDTLTANGNVNLYDFTTSASQAYGNNLKLKGGKYCLYTGDLTQSGFVDGSDAIRVHSDSQIFLTGRFLLSDLNGDNIVDGSDYSIVDNNAYNFVGTITP